MVSSVYKVRGCVDKLTDLPKDAGIGDIYVCGDGYYVMRSDKWEQIGNTVYQAKTEIPSGITAYSCPSCGAPVPLRSGTHCDYCGSWLAKYNI